MENEYSAKEFQEMLKTGVITTGKKGRLKQAELLPEYETMLKENKRVKGAKKCEWKGIRFDSQLERDYYIYLSACDIKFEHQKKFILQEKFKKDKLYRELTWTADFYFPEQNIIVDTKGFSTDVFKIKLKLFRFKYDIPVHIITKKSEFYTTKQILNLE